MNALLASRESRAADHQEFPEGAAEPPSSSVDRRQFLGILGSTAALAGVGLQGCMRKRTRNIVPFTSRPEDYLPGEARYYATNLFIGGEALPLLVRSNDGRPSKIDGNPRSTETLGRSTVFAQAEILRLFDTDRARTARQGDKELSLNAVGDALDELRTTLAATQGEGFAVVVPPTPSPSLRAQLNGLNKALPKTRTFVVDTKASGNQAAALEAVGAKGANVVYNLDEARVIFTLDADILHTEGEILRNTIGFSNNRKIDTPEGELNRVYSVEPMYSVTGSNADHNIRIPASQIGRVAKAVAAGVGVSGVSADAPEGTEAFVEALVKDLKANRGQSVVAVGDRQPAWVHQLGFAINDALGNTAKTFDVIENDAVPQGDDFEALYNALNDGEIQTILTLGVNTVYSAPGGWNFAEAFQKAENRITLAFHRDETAKASTLHIPEAHPLECWGDLQANSGRLGIQQPLIEPIFPALSPLQVIDRLLGEEQRDDHDIVRKTWARNVGGIGFQTSWKQWLHDGVGPQRDLASASLDLSGVAQAASDAEQADAPSNSQVEVVLQNSPAILDGRYGNVSWMQEFSHPISKLTWDNAALMSPQTAQNLGVKWGGARKGDIGENAHVLKISVNGQSVKLPAFVVPGIAENVIVTEFGYGRDLGPVSKGAGVDVRALQGESNSWIAPGATVEVTREKYKLASTQDHWSLVPSLVREEGVPEEEQVNYRPLVRQTDLETYRKRPDVVRDHDLDAPDNIKSLWTLPNPRTGQQWGMSIDLNACTGCGACTIACQSENNIPVVGKSQVLNGREMTWIRIDRYFTGDEDNPGIVQQPVGCQHCETAPCEAVCPVAATIHSADGLNDMVYNRCIGTRYCANNCPYKVRRFNYLAYNRYDTESNELLELQRNPNVTIRHRGVMEKCTYCVQRINHARIEARRDHDGIVADGAIRTACEQACPSGAIVFGDINDPTSRVSIAKRQDRDYQLLAWLNTQPRTSYLAKVRNPNPELA